MKIPRESPPHAERHEVFLRSILDALPSHLAVLNEHGEVIDVNASWRRFASANNGDDSVLGPGVNYLEICDRAAEHDADGAADVARWIREVIAGQRDTYHMCYPCHSPHEQRWYQVRVSRCQDIEPLRVIVSHESITESQESERLSRRFQSDLAHMMRLGTINEMATGLAHELNQPLATISNYASGCIRRLDQADDVETLREALATIASEAQRAGEIIRRVRRFVRKGSAMNVEMSLDEVVMDATSLIAGLAKDAGIEIVHRFEHLPIAVYGDPVQVQQVLVNVMRNAVEAIRDAEGDLVERRVTVRTARDMPSNARVDVIDTGPGLEKDQIPTLFDPFFTTKGGEGELDSESGLGLGLSLCRSIIDAHRGDIWADTNRYGGLTFSFTLPLHQDGVDDG